MALSESKEVVAKEGKLLAMQVAASTVIYKGAMLTIDASGFAKPADGSAETFVGIAYEEVDNSAGANGDKEVRVIRNELHLLKGSGLAQSNLFDDAYASNDEDIIVTGQTTEPKVGKVVEVVSATEAYVDITK